MPLPSAEARPQRRDRTGVPGGDDGMVTAEIACALPALLLVLGLALGLVTVGLDDIRCLDAARVGARAAARGDDGLRIAQATAPAGAAVAVSRAGTEVTVTVIGPQRPALGWLPASLHPRAQARAEVEEAT